MSIMHILSTAQAKKMDQLATMPWLKFDFTSYEQSEFRAANSPIARLAFVELTMRSIRTGFKLPKNDAALATWAGITKAQWAKVKDAVVSQFEDGGSHYICTSIAELYGEYVASNDTQVADESPKSKVAERVRRHREAKRNAQNSADVTLSVTPVTSPVTLDVTHVTPACNADVTLDTVTSVTNGGIKGGDLDQDLDLENNKHTQSVCEDFTPDLDCLNHKLKMAGAQPVTQEQLNQTLVTFVPHYETHHLTDNQRMGKLVQWIKGDQAKAARPAKSKAKAEQPVYGNVNDHWGNPPPQDLDTGFVMPEELKAKIANLRSVKSS
jgi:uncharacterized protein YdaU (DUF1376 family)